MKDEARALWLMERILLVVTNTLHDMCIKRGDNPAQSAVVFRALDEALKALAKLQKGEEE